VFDRLIEIIDLAHPATDDQRFKAKEMIDKFRCYFKRGSVFFSAWRRRARALTTDFCTRCLTLTRLNYTLSALITPTIIAKLSW